MSSRLLVPGCLLFPLAGLAGAQAAGASGSRSPIPDLIASLAYLELSYELTGAQYVISHADPSIDDTKFWTLKYPWEKDIDVGARDGRLYLEAAAGILSASDGIQIGTAQGVATADTEWISYGGLVGAGWTQSFGEHWKLRPSLGFSLTRLENDTDYNAAGQLVLAPILDNGFANFDASAAMTLASITLLYERAIGDVKTHWRARWSQFTTDVFESSSPEQEGRDQSSSLALRADLDGPTPLRVAGLPIDWGAFVGYVGLNQVDEDAPGFSKLYELGLSAKAPVEALFSALSLTGSLIFGDDVRGFSVGMSVAL